MIRSRFRPFVRSVSSVAMAAAVASLPVASGCGRRQSSSTQPSEEAAVPVAARRAEVGRIRDVLHASGLTVPAEGAEFLAVAPEPARVIEVTKKPGDAVESGEVLVRFELPSAAGDVARQRAEVARVRSELERTRVASGRAHDLVDRGLISRREAEDAERALSEAQAAVTRAEALQTATEAVAARAVVRSPFAGVVVTRIHNPGDVVQPTMIDPVLRVVDPRRLEVTAAVPAEQMPHVLPGTTARLAGGAGAASVRLTAAARTADGRVRLTPLDPLPFAVDTPVEVDIDLEERPAAVLVPPQAIVREGAKAAVFVAAGDRAQRREVDTGVVTEESIEIVSGLRAGELVITQGQTGLQDGARISVATTP